MILLMNMSAAVGLWPTGPAWLMWVGSGVLGAAVGVTVQALRRAARLQKQLTEQEQFAARLLEGQEKDRKRMAADLHDGLGQNLLLIKNRVVLALQSRDRTHAEAQLHAIASVASESIEEMRKISRNLRPYQLDRLGLTKAMRALVKQAAQTSAIDFRMDIEGVDDVFPPEVEINLYRIVQEALTNAIKHSGATRAEITVRRVDQGCRILITDNGCGFRAADPVRSGTGPIGMGLKTIKERARMAGGELRLNTGPGAGVQLEVLLANFTDESWRAQSKS